MILKRKTYSGEDYLKNQAKKKFRDSLKNAEDVKIVGEALKDKVIRLGRSKTFRKNAAIATIGALGTSLVIDKLSKKKKEKQKEFAFLGIGNVAKNWGGMMNSFKSAGNFVKNALGQARIGAQALAQGTGAAKLGAGDTAKALFNTAGQAGKRVLKGVGTAGLDVASGIGQGAKALGTGALYTGAGIATTGLIAGKALGVDKALTGDNVNN